MSLIENVSDTARWVCVYRARENDRPNGLFRDPYAGRLAGARGAEIAARMKSQDRNEWAYVIRTYLFDSFIQEQIDGGVDMVINLAAGLDARPYRMNVPPSLQWIEVDLPEITEYKEEVLEGETPRCSLEREKLDLADAGARRQLFDRLAAKSKKALIVSEGLLIYLGAENVRSLADDLAARPSFKRWVFDIGSPGLLKMMMKQVGKELNAASAPLKFAPAEGPEFFAASGWRVAECRSTFKTAGEKKRLPFILSLFAKLPEPKKPGNRPWSATCLVTRE